MGIQLVKARRCEDARDRVLTREASRGDKPAIEALYKRYCDRIYQSCLRICREPEDAIDATQDTFLKVFRRLEELDPETLSFRDYLFASARNACFKVVSKRKRVDLKEKMPEPRIKMVDDAHADPERSLMIEDQQKMVRHASTELSTRHYQALVMYELDGLGYAEIGKQLDLDANAVGQLIMRARQRLRLEVRRRAVLQTDEGKQCARALALLPRKADGRLGKREAQWLDPHLENCEACTTNLSLMQEVGAGYRAVLPPALIGLLWLRTSDALANAGHPFSDRAVTADESRDVSANGGSGQGQGTAGELRSINAISRRDRSKKVVVLACLMFGLLAVVVAGSEYLPKEDFRTVNGDELSLLQPGIDQYYAPSGTDDAESLGLTETGKTSSSKYWKHSGSERSDDGSVSGKTRSDSQGSRSKTGTDNGAEGWQSKPRGNPRLSSEGSSGTHPAQGADQQAGVQHGVQQTSNSSRSSNQGSSSEQQESNDTDTTGFVPKASSSPGSWPTPKQIPGNTPPLPSIKDLTKLKIPASFKVKPKEEILAPCTPWPQCLRRDN